VTLNAVNLIPVFLKIHLSVVEMKHAGEQIKQLVLFNCAQQAEMCLFCSKREKYYHAVVRETQTVAGFHRTQQCTFYDSG